MHAEHSGRERNEHSGRQNEEGDFVLDIRRTSVFWHISSPAVALRQCFAASVHSEAFLGADLFHQRTCLCVDVRGAVKKPGMRHVRTSLIGTLSVYTLPVVFER